jgi:hypothetical protein
MSEVILVLLRRPDRALVLLHAAARLAEMMGKVRIQALAVHERVLPSAFAAEALMYEADAALEANEEEQNRVTSLAAIYDRWVGDLREDTVLARWVEAEGNTTAIVAERGSRADVIVAGQPAEDDRVPRQMFRAALFGTDRPVLMVPPRVGGGFGHCVAIAWRDEKQAARAVVPALRWLAGAEQVHVLMGVRSGAAQPGMPPVLREHGIAAIPHVLPIGSRSFGRTCWTRPTRSAPTCW